MMQWKTLLNAKRLGDRPEKSELGRSPFLCDYDKVIFSGAFRRLARKTQVHPLASHDMVHNRMTHSLEVASVGRTLAIRIGEQLQQKRRLPDHVLPTDLGDIVQSICLSHDIGNPPFGHTGEEAIRQWFQNDNLGYLARLPEKLQADFKSFDGNAQGLRVLMLDESKGMTTGMHLTYATLGAFMKYPKAALYEQDKNKQEKFGILASEYMLMHEVAMATGLLIHKNNAGDVGYSRHPLSFLMEAADDFCYGLIDLEDGMAMGILQWQDVFNASLPLFNDATLVRLEQELNAVAEHKRPTLLRGRVIDAYISAAVNAFMEHEEGFLSGKISGDLIDLCDEPVRKSVFNAKKLAKERIFSHPKKVELEIGAYDVIATVLQALVSLVIKHLEHDTSGLSDIQRQLLAELIDGLSAGSLFDEHALLSGVLDFVAGMTDNYAVHLSQILLSQVAD